MTEKAIQWQVQDMLKRIERLQYEIERGITADGTDEQRLIFLQSTIDEFQNLSSLKTDLTYEVATNISKGLRPAQELTYLESLEELLEYIDYTYTLVEKQDWEDTILDRLMILSGRIYIGANKAVRLQERDKELIVILIEQVRASCYELDKECIEIGSAR